MQKKDREDARVDKVGGHREGRRGEVARGRARDLKPKGERDKANRFAAMPPGLPPLAVAGGLRRLALEKVAGKLNCADLLTKRLGIDDIKKWLGLMTASLREMFSTAKQDS